MVPQDILLEKSLIDCHVQGLDSLVIKDGPNMVRIFIAREDHGLWKNKPTPKGVFQEEFTVALHRHRKDTTLMPILGHVTNICPSEDPRAIPVTMKTYKYNSPILGEVGGFELLDGHGVPLALEMRQMNTPTFMKADKLHSIYVPKGETAAWFVWEGGDAPHYSPIVYSNADLTDFDFSVMDRPMESGRLREDLEIIGVRC